MFLDEKGEKISKSAGNGISIDEWLSYASAESLSYFMYQKPRTAKRLHFDVIPKAMDEYDAQVRGYAGQDLAEQMNNPVFHIHGGDVPEAEPDSISFSMLLNLAAVSGAYSKDILWQFIQKYAPDASPETHPKLDESAGFAVRYFHDFVKPNLNYRRAGNKEYVAMEDLALALVDTNMAKWIIDYKIKKISGEDFDDYNESNNWGYDDTVGTSSPSDYLMNVLEDSKDWSPDNADDLQVLVFAIGKINGIEPMRDWFKALYEVLLGKSDGPRFGSFIAIYGAEETAKLIENALENGFSRD